MNTFSSNGSVLMPVDDRALAYIRRRSGHDVELSEAGHSPSEHRFAFKYLEYLHSQFADQYRTREVFRAQVSLDIGHVEKFRVRLRVAYLQKLIDQLEKTGWVDLEYPASWSHGKSDREMFHDLVNRLDEWGLDHVGIGIAEWRAKHGEYRSA